MAKGRVEVREDYCKSCGLCVAVCPKGYRPVEQSQEGCIACALCARICPDVVLTVYRTDE